ncbi:MAG: putative Cytoplasmic dynein 2 heavy chain 1, partial [Streblomastix strix]
MEIREALNVHDEYMNEMKEMEIQEWVYFRSKLTQFEDFLNKWRDYASNITIDERDSIQQQDVDKRISPSPSLTPQQQLNISPKQTIRSFLVSQLDKLSELPQSLKLVRGDDYTDEHWRELFRIIQMPQSVIEQLQKEKIQKIQQLRALQRKAQGEVDIRKGMEEIRIWGTYTQLTLSDHICYAQQQIAGQKEEDGKSKGRLTSIVEDWSDILSALDDKSAQLNAMKDSPFFPPFKDQSDQWEQRFTVLGAAGRQLMSVQRRWVYLEPVFLRGAIPSQQQRFMNVDKQFRQIMTSLKEDPSLPTIYHMKQIDVVAEEMSKELEKCQQALAEFLEEKRDKFPRFYFIGDDDLLEILGQAQNPTVIQAHLKKLFQGIHRVVFSQQGQGGSGKNSIIGMCSAAGEVVKLVNNVPVSDAVEDWLNALTAQMRLTLSFLISQSLPIGSYNDSVIMDNSIYLFNYIEYFPSQVLCLVELISFTKQCETALQTKGLQLLLNKLKQRLSSLSELASKLTAAGHIKEDEQGNNNEKDGKEQSDNKNSNLLMLQQSQFNKQGEFMSSIIQRKRINDKDKDGSNPFKLTLPQHQLIDIKIKGLIFDIIHCIDVVEQLMKIQKDLLQGEGNGQENIVQGSKKDREIESSQKAFWFQQMRHYEMTTEGVIINNLNSNKQGQGNTGLNILNAGNPFKDIGQQKQGTQNNQSSSSSLQLFNASNLNTTQSILEQLPLRVSIQMADAKFEQTFEYQGNGPRLVHTPLTDKCYMVLTQAMLLGYGGHPYGPAGTGKTESVKALGQALGRQVLVFNCDEGIDAKGMGRIFRGIVKCGAWGCFDEFNRLEPMVLSAISQQIQAIQRALKEKQQFLYMGSDNKQDNSNQQSSQEQDKNNIDMVRVDSNSKGYGGRSVLPDNLTQLFRSVAMSAPDNELISEVILLSEGFTDARKLAGKLVSIFKLAKDQLSKQVHYDWGLRSLKVILNTAGMLLKKELAAISTEREKQIKDKEKQQQQQSSSNSLITPQKEEELVVQALKSNTLSKLTFNDSILFNSLLCDIFPSSRIVMQIEREELESAIKKSLTELKLGQITSQIDKIVQLEQALHQRMGVVLVGASGCGKSTLWKVLQKAYSFIQKPLHVHAMNPKALPRSQLLGRLDLDTRKWHDGILSSRARLMSKESENIANWLVCDGDIDPEWIESLNSVLDDNRLLTLPSGERIQFQPGAPVNFVFETDSLRFASPATVSRMAVIFLSDEDLGIEKLVDAWVRKETDNEKQDQLRQLSKELLIPSIEFVANSLGFVTGNSQSSSQINSTFILPTTLTGLVRNALSHLVGCQNKSQYSLGLIRGLGANVNEQLQNEIIQFISKKTGLQLQGSGEKGVKSHAPLSLTLSPDNKRLISFEDNCRQPDVEGVLQAENGELLLNTSEAQTIQSLFIPWIENGNHFLLVGPEGSGKHMLLRETLNKLVTGGGGAEIAEVNCSTQTSANTLADAIKQHSIVLSSAKGRILRPRRGQRLVLFLSDLHLPRADKYDTVEPVAFAQQLVTYGGFFDTDLEWTIVEGVQVIVTIVGKDSGSVNEGNDGIGGNDNQSSSSSSSSQSSDSLLSPRFVANVRVASVPHPRQSSLTTVYTNMIEAITKQLRHRQINSSQL